ncbi:60S ribosomal protein L18a-like protein [Pyrus ussuriensis x Pyrus communis]|uniref:60S ribosomal protein L18a-like protein n=1 Tax=Pyrus ussuriensis x Pyrus communis TaxID=2448454 RepID=A0A5N5H9C1_9ROSA|nr:60S ribosomal protein L18a-like protein [Pyrus ussuriensis x Pyrus communis]
MGEDEKERGVSSDHHHHHPPPPPEYGTFQGVANYPPPPPPTGFPQPAPPPGAANPSASHPESYPYGYQTVPGYAVAEGRPIRERRLRCCGCGLGWCLLLLQQLLLYLVQQREVMAGNLIGRSYIALYDRYIHESGFSEDYAWMSICL